MRILAIMEPLIAVFVLWLFVNLIHAVLTMKSKQVNGIFFYISNKIKQELGGNNGQK